MRLYLDAMVWIYAFEATSSFAAPARGLFQTIEDAGHTILVSHFLLAELLVMPIHRNDQFTVARYRHMLFGTEATEAIPFGMSAASHFATLRAAHRVKQPDAIHLALAASVNADAFITADTRLSKLTLPGIAAIGDLTTPLR